MVQGYPSQISSGSGGRSSAIGETISGILPSPAVEDSPTALPPVRILVEIRMSNGLRLFRKNLSYPALKCLIEGLEVLC